MISVFKTTEHGSQNQHEGRVNDFMKNFSNKSPEGLRKIVDDDELVPEAIEAARRLLKEKDALK